MAKFAFRVFASGTVTEPELREALTEISSQAARFIVGQRHEKPGKQSPLGRHFVRTNLRRYNWPPLSPAYAARKRAQFGTLPVMVRTGALRDDALQNVKITANERGAVIELTVLDYGLFHIAGGPNLPQRDWSAPNEEDVEQTADFMDRIAQRFFDDLSIQPDRRIV